MVIMLANENSASEGASFAEKCDMVALTRKWLRANPNSCKEIRVSVHGGPKLEGRPHIHGSIGCISTFLGNTNWSRTAVARIFTDLGLKDKDDSPKLTDEVKHLVQSQLDDKSHRPVAGKISQAAVPTIAKLDKSMQVALAAAIDYIIDKLV
jgi:hypothetical protein